MHDLEHINARRKRLLLMVPCWNEEKVIARTIEQLVEWRIGFEKVTGALVTIIIVDNGSTDATGQLGRDAAMRYSQVEYVAVSEKGRGRALRVVAGQYDADIYMYVDADLPLPIEQISSILVPILNSTADIVVGKRSGDRPWKRKIMTFALRQYIGVVSNLRVHDIQCGIKAWDSRVQEVVRQTQENGFFWDTELLICTAQQGFRVHEVDVDWIERRYRDRTSTVRPLADGLRAVRAIHSIWKRMRSPERTVWQFSIITLGLMWIAWAAFLFWISWLPVWGLIFFSSPQFNAWKAWIAAGGAIVLPIITYVLIPKLTKTLPTRRIAAILIVSAIIVWSICICARPLDSQDVYWNISYGQSWVFFHHNPYVQVLTDIKPQLWFKDIIYYDWLPMTHGALWMWIVGGLVKLTGSGAGTLFALKISAVCAYAFTCICALRLTIFSTASQRLRTMAMMTLSPALLYFVLIDVHNDVYIMLAFTSALFFLQRKRYELSGYALVFGGLIKYVPLLLIGIPLIALWRDQTLQRSRKWILTVRCLVITAIAFVVLYAPFGYSVDVLTGATNEFVSRYYLLYSTPPVALLHVLFKSSIPIRVFGFMALMVIAYGFAWIRRPIQGMIFGVCGLLAFGTPWLLGWYGIWILPAMTVVYPGTAVVLHATLPMLGTQVTAFVWSLALTLVLLTMYLVDKLKIIRRNTKTTLE